MHVNLIILQQEMIITKTILVTISRTREMSHVMDVAVVCNDILGVQGNYFGF